MKRVGIPTLTLLWVLLVGLPSPTLANDITGHITPATLTLVLGVGEESEEQDKWVLLDADPYADGGPCNGMTDFDCVELDLSLVPAGVSVFAQQTGVGSPNGSYGFYFDVWFTGVTPGVHTFPIGAMVMGLRAPGITPEQDSITVVPEPTTLLLLGTGLVVVGGRRRMRNAA